MNNMYSVNIQNIENLTRQISGLNTQELELLLKRIKPEERQQVFTSIIYAKLKATRCIEGQVVCPECGSIHTKKNSIRNGVQRFKCHDCHKQFSATTNSIFSGMHMSLEPKFIKFIECMLNNLSLHKCQEICQIAYDTAFAWRHKILVAVSKMHIKDKVSGIIELDDKFFRKSFKGNHKNLELPRRARHHGIKPRQDKRGVSNQKIAVSTAIDRSGNVVCGITGLGSPTADQMCAIYQHRINKIRASRLVVDGWKAYPMFAQQVGLKITRLTKKNYQDTNNKLPVIRGKYHIQHVNNFHSQIESIINGQYKGVASKYLMSYVNWCKWLRINGQSFNGSKDVLINELVSAQICERRVDISKKRVW